MGTPVCHAVAAARIADLNREALLARVAGEAGDGARAGASGPRGSPPV